MIEIDKKQMEVVKKLFKGMESKLPTILMRAINRAADNAKTNMGKETSRNYIVKAGDVKSTVKIVKANTRRLGAIVISNGAKVPLYKFKVSPSIPKPKNPPKAYKVKVKKSGNLKSILGAFVADINGYNRVMQRESKKRLPITQLYGPSIPEMIGNKSVSQYIENEAAKTLEKRIDHEIKRIMEAK